MTAVNIRATLRARIEAVRQRIAAACEEAGRDAGDVRLIGVTKGVGADAVREAAAAGLEDLGENYVQELRDKRTAAPGARWHFVGRLQRNKVRRVLELSDAVHTLEEGAATDRLLELAAPSPIDALIEVDFTRARVGVSPERVEGFADRLASSPGVRLRGLMTVAPHEGEPRAWFARLRELRDRLEDRFEGRGELSMGMSNDLEAAIEQGATMVRVGTAIFGPRARR